jgi:hypothetical protein
VGGQSLFILLRSSNNSSVEGWGEMPTGPTAVFAGAAGNSSARGVRERVTDSRGELADVLFNAADVLFDVADILFDPADVLFDPADILFDPADVRGNVIPILRSATRIPGGGGGGGGARAR